MLCLPYDSSRSAPNLTAKSRQLRGMIRPVWLCSLYDICVAPAAERALANCRQPAGHLDSSQGIIRSWSVMQERITMCVTIDAPSDGSRKYPVGSSQTMPQVTECLQNVKTAQTMLERD